MKNKWLDLISKIASLCLCFVLFVMISMYIGLLVAPNLITKDNVTTIINDIDMQEVLSANESNSLNQLYEIADNNNIDREIVNGVINSNEFKTLISNYYGDVTEYLLTGEEGDIITSNQIIDIFNSILDRTSNELGIALTEEQRDSILTQVEEKAPEIVEVFPTYEEISSEISEDDMNVVRVLLGNSSKTVLLIMIIIVILIIAVIRWSIFRFAIWTGVTTVLAGGVFIAIGGLGNIAMDLLLEEYSTAIIELLKNDIFGIFINYGFMTLVIGVVQIIYYFVIRNRFNQKEA